MATSEARAKVGGGAEVARRLVLLRGASSGEELASRPLFTLDGTLSVSMVIFWWFCEEVSGAGGYSSLLCGMGEVILASDKRKVVVAVVVVDGGRQKREFEPQVRLGPIWRVCRRAVGWRSDGNGC